MPRHEIPVLTNFVLEDAPGQEVGEGEHRVIRFDGREIVWHVNESDPERGRMLPTVCMRSDGWKDESHYRAEVLHVQRFLSALSFNDEVAITTLFFGFNHAATDPPDRVVFRQPGWPLPLCHGLQTPSEIVAVQDERLRLALALYRKGRSSLNPYDRFLAYWNALEAVFQPDPKNRRRDSYIEKAPRRWKGVFHGWDPVPTNLVRHLQGSSRNAVAHLVNTTDGSILDPDDPADWSRLDKDARVVERLLRFKIEERWPHPVYCQRPSSPTS